MSFDVREPKHGHYIATLSAVPVTWLYSLHKMINFNPFLISFGPLVQMKVILRIPSFPGALGFFSPKFRLSIEIWVHTDMDNSVVITMYQYSKRAFFIFLRKYIFVLVHQYY